MASQWGVTFVISPVSVIPGKPFSCMAEVDIASYKCLFFYQKNTTMLEQHRHPKSQFADCCKIPQDGTYIPFPLHSSTLRVVQTIRNYVQLKRNFASILRSTICYLPAIDAFFLFGIFRISRNNNLQ